jgi:antitoxin (DNA-binding transcriptional repressor) of toxin-antitoxin stability system
VFDQDERPTLGVKVADARDQRAHERGVHAGSGLVQEDHLGVAHQHPRQFEELLLTPGERFGQGVSEGRQVHELEDLQRAPPEYGLLLPDLTGGREHAPERLAALSLGVDEEVLEHGHPSQRAGDLERPAHTEASDGVTGEPIKPFAPEPDLARVGGDEAADRVEEGGLARAVGPDETGDGPRRHVDRAPGERRHAAKPLGHIDHREERSPVQHARILHSPGAEGHAPLPLPGKGWGGVAGCMSRSMMHRNTPSGARVRLMYNVLMPRYSTAQARQRLAELLDAAEAGQPVVIARRGVEFTLRAESARSRRGPARRRVTLKVIDPAVAEGQWTWRWDAHGLRFSPRRLR